jgi:hypothetical protein
MLAGLGFTLWGLLSGGAISSRATGSDTVSRGKGYFIGGLLTLALGGAVPLLAAAAWAAGSFFL